MHYRNINRATSVYIEYFAPDLEIKHGGKIFLSLSPFFFFFFINKS